jgi:hypothetical protein
MYEPMSPLNTASTGSSEYKQLLREVAADKIFYKRDILSPADFEEAIDEELRIMATPVLEYKSFRQIARSIRKRISRIFKSTRSLNCCAKAQCGREAGEVSCFAHIISCPRFEVHVPSKVALHLRLLLQHNIRGATSSSPLRHIRNPQRKQWELTLGRRETTVWATNRKNNAAFLMGASTRDIKRRWRWKATSK